MYLKKISFVRTFGADNCQYIIQNTISLRIRISRKYIQLQLSHLKFTPISRYTSLKVPISSYQKTRIRCNTAISPDGNLLISFIDWRRFLSPLSPALIHMHARRRRHARKLER